MTKTIKYFNETTQQWERVGGGATGDLSGKVDGSLRLTASSTAPATPAVGDLWVDIDEASDIFGTNGQVVKEEPTGAKNGVNTTFTTSRGYIPNTLQVYVNGIAQSRMVTESNPSAGLFSIDALQSTDDLVVSYQFANTVAGNADTIDGFHASQSPTANTILVLDSTGKVPSPALGTLGYTQVTANQTGFGAADLTGLTLTVTTSGTERIKITAFANITNNQAGANYGEMSIAEGSTVLQKSRSPIPVANLPSSSITATCVITPSAGSHTYKTALAFYTGQGGIVASATEPAYILIERI